VGVTSVCVQRVPCDVSSHSELFSYYKRRHLMHLLQQNHHYHHLKHNHKIRKIRQCVSSGSHGDKYEYYSRLGYEAVWPRRSRPTFKRCVLPPSH
jgi:hypothetical protein